MAKLQSFNEWLGTKTQSHFITMINETYANNKELIRHLVETADVEEIKDAIGDAIKDKNMLGNLISKLTSKEALMSLAVALGVFGGVGGRRSADGMPDRDHLRAMAAHTAKPGYGQDKRVNDPNRMGDDAYRAGSYEIDKGLAPKRQMPAF